MLYGHSESQTKTLIWMVWLSNFNGSSIQKCDSMVPPPVWMGVVLFVVGYFHNVGCSL